MKLLASRTAREGKNEANTFLIVHFFSLNACSTETNERLSHANAPVESNISCLDGQICTLIHFKAHSELYKLLHCEVETI